MRSVTAMSSEESLILYSSRTFPLCKVVSTVAVLAELPSIERLPGHERQRRQLDGRDASTSHCDERGWAAALLGGMFAQSQAGLGTEMACW